MESGGGREQSRPLTAEEEALKRNTDCVYFLASPLTCKKGIECEYRHSEGARLNPRDCWYWLNGNCWNPKCTFRHPPLDGLFGIQGTTSGLVSPPSQTVALTHVPAANGSAAYNLNKQNVPCYYFQKGHCLKGDRCPFMHGPQQTDNSVPQQVAKAATSPPDPVSALEKESCGLKECSSQQRMHKENFDKPVEVPLALVKPAAKSENVLNNGSAIKQTASPFPSEDDLPRVQQSNVPVNSGIALDQTQSRQPIDEHYQNGREADEFLKESSPGFDVLVDNNMDDSDYFHNEGDFGRVPIQGGRNLNHVSDFDHHHSDHELVPSLERGQYNGIGDYDRYGCLGNWYGQQQQRTSSERIPEIAPIPEKRMLQREEGYHDIDVSDLRHRLLKKRRLNGLRSTISSNHCGKLFQRDNYLFDEERHHARHPGRSHRRFPVESTISSRLQGRITFPARLSSDRPTDLWSEKDRDKGRHRGRSSPVSPVNYQGRHHDKIKRRPDFSDGRNVGVQPIRREDADRLNFAGPKSLSELKGAKLSENFQDQKNIEGQALGHQEAEGSLSFEGPKPLSVILKRKRETAGNGANCSNVDKNNQRYIEGGIGSSASEATEKSNHAANCPKESKVAGVDEEEGEDMILIEGKELANDHRTSAKGNTHEGKDGMIMDDDQEVERAESEAVERGQFQPEDDDTYQQEEEDDEDDFARKVGVMFS